jgi:acyl-coenzyme A synthetase/AMP-(fatty) acid ligase
LIPERVHLPWHVDFSDTADFDSKTPLCVKDTYQVYFTSGTSEKPKGVTLSNDIVCKHAVCTITEMRLSQEDNWLHVAPMFHLVDAFSIYAVTATSGTHTTQQIFEANATLGIIEREGITVTNMASTMILLLCTNNALRTFDLTSLRLLSCGGSSLPPATVKRVIASFGCEFFVSYGMTECCGKISMSKLNACHHDRHC